jgi:hypothetical protein
VKRENRRGHEPQLLHDVDRMNSVIEEREDVGRRVACARFVGETRCASQRQPNGFDLGFIEEVNTAIADDRREHRALAPAQGADAHSEDASGIRTLEQLAGLGDHGSYLAGSRLRGSVVHVPMSS